MNPELRRNLWIEITPHRLISMPAVLGGLFSLVYLWNDAVFGGEVATAARLAAILLVVVWGASLAAESIVSEVRGGTWESQRMSALTPWQLTWGKLFGGTIFAWYGAAISLAVYVAAAGGTRAAFELAAMVALAGVLSQGVSLLLVLYTLRKNRRTPRLRAGLYAVIGLLVAYPLLELGSQRGGAVVWYGTAWPRADFALVSLALFDAWLALAIQRAMRIELQMRNALWIWAAFVVWMMCYAAGFGALPFREGGEWSVRISAACLTGLALFYVTAFVESKDPVHLSRLVAAMRGGRWASLKWLSPDWAVALMLTWAALALLFAAESRGFGLSASAFLASALLFALRDLGVVLALNFGKRRERADVAALVYLAVLYGLLPLILIRVVSGAEFLFYPQAGAEASWAMFAATIQATLAFWFARRRWRRHCAVAVPQPEAS